MNQTQMQATIMKELGLENLPQEKQEELLAKMGEVILKKMFLATIDKLDSEASAKFEKMLEEKNSPENIESFLKENISDYDEMLKKIVIDFKKEMKKELQG